MNPNTELIPHLFRTEFRKIVSVLSKHFGLNHIEIAEDIVSDTFLIASETWGLKGLPENPTAWLYSVAKNKAKDYLKRNELFTKKIATEIKRTESSLYEQDIDLTTQNIEDSQLQMMFAICHPAIAPEAQIGLALRILCGLGIEEIAEAFLTNKENTNKRLFRAKEKLREVNAQMQFPAKEELDARLDSVLSVLYLLFSEGYYSASQNVSLRKDLCLEAMRLNLLLIENQLTNKPFANALLSLMCFHASRFEARISESGETILYDEQDTSFWDRELILRGEYYLNQASVGNVISKYHVEAAIAYWHTQTNCEIEKWENILQLYNKLLQIDYSPMAALNRTYALAKARDCETAIREAEKLELEESHWYHALLGELYTVIDQQKAHAYFQKAIALSKTDADRSVLQKKKNQMEVTLASEPVKKHNTQ
jgi:RNA polymerase sigma factor (sigma-70 family)